MFAVASLSELFSDSILRSCVGSIFAYVIISLIRYFIPRRKEQSHEEELQSIRNLIDDEEKGTAFSTIQVILYSILSVASLWLIIFTLSPGGIPTQIDQLPHWRILHFFFVAILISLFVLLQFKVSAVRRATVYQLMAIGINDCMSMQDFSRDYNMDEPDDKEEVRSLFHALLKKILLICVETQSPFYRWLVKLFLFGSINEIETAIWIKLPNFHRPDRQFQAHDFYVIPETAHTALNRYNRVELPFHDHARFVQWENECAQYKQMVNEDPQNEILRITYKEKLIEEYSLTSETGKIYTYANPVMILNYGWSRYKELQYLPAFENNLKEFNKHRIRSAVGLPIISNGKKLGVVMITSNIPMGIRKNERSLLKQFSGTIGMFVSIFSRAGYFGPDYTDLIQNAEPYNPAD